MGCACTAKEDNTRWDDKYMDGVRNMFSLLGLIQTTVMEMGCGQQVLRVRAQSVHCHVL